LCSTRYQFECEKGILLDFLEVWSEFVLQPHAFEVNDDVLLGEAKPLKDTENLT